MLLALCLWGVCAADYSTLRLFDRAGNVKFQPLAWPDLPLDSRLIFSSGIHRIVMSVVVHIIVRNI